MAAPGYAARTHGGNTTRRSSEHAECDLYLPGHLVHFIQAKKAWESGDPVRWGRFERVDEGCLVVCFLDGRGRYRVHRPAEVGRVAEAGDKVRVSERWRVASISRRFEQLLAVCIALPDDPWRPCRLAPQEPASCDGPAERIDHRGGFVAPGSVVSQLFGSRPRGGDDTPPADPFGAVS